VFDAKSAHRARSGEAERNEEKLMALSGRLKGRQGRLLARLACQRGSF
jgi:hypothetical protein